MVAATTQQTDCRAADDVVFIVHVGMCLMKTQPRQQGGKRIPVFARCTQLLHFYQLPAKRPSTNCGYRGYPPHILLSIPRTWVDSEVAQHYVAFGVYYAPDTYTHSSRTQCYQMVAATGCWHRHLPPSTACATRCRTPPDSQQF